MQVCPMVFYTSQVKTIMQMRRWFESGQLGISYMDAPSWLVEALSTLSSAINDAREFVRATKTPPSKG